MVTDSEHKQEFLRISGATVANWLKTRQRVKESADYHASHDWAKGQHETWLALHKFNTDSLKRLFAHASELGDVDEIELSHAAGISPVELREIRENLN
jgi:hypothetical protein